MQSFMGSRPSPVSRHASNVDLVLDGGVTARLPGTPVPLTRLADGTIKQVNPFTGTQVWTVPGRANRPLVSPDREPQPLLAQDRGRHCAFCEGRYLETPPERERLVRKDDGWARIEAVPAGEVFDTVADFRLVPNLFEIVSYDYWRANHGYEIGEQARRRLAAYLRSTAGRRPPHRRPGGAFRRGSGRGGAGARRAVLRRLP